MTKAQGTETMGAYETQTIFCESELISDIEIFCVFRSLLVAEVGESPIGIFTKYNWIENRIYLLDFINVFIPEMIVSVFIQFLSLSSKMKKEIENTILKELAQVKLFIVNSS